MIEKYIRENIRNLKPYSTIRDKQGNILLDANENLYGSVINNNMNYNIYPDSEQLEIREKMASILNISYKNLIFGTGSDEIIDLLLRLFCNPAKDNIIIPVPAFGMYENLANINNIRLIYSLLGEDYNLDTEDILLKINNSTKLIVINNPHNPTGKLLKYEDILIILETGVPVILDEAYIDFCNYPKTIPLIKQYPNLIIIRTFSKLWGLAFLRCGYCIADEVVINYLKNIKPPYNLSGITQSLISEAIDNIRKTEYFKNEIIKERETLFERLKEIKSIDCVYHSSANFILIRSMRYKEIIEVLKNNNILVADRSSLPLLENCIRITVGRKEDNNKLIKALESL